MTGKKKQNEVNEGNNMENNLQLIPAQQPNMPMPTSANRSTIPSDHEMMVYHTMAEQAVTSKMYSSNFKEKSGVMMVMLAARELGIPPMQALNGGINIISGKVEISARMMNALIRKAGHQIKVKESTDNHCVLIGKRCDTGETLEVSFSLADAQKAGLVKSGGGWTKFPKDMCFARALSRLARQLFSDVIGIGYVEGEIKPVDAEIIMPEDIVHVEEVPVEDEAAMIQDFISKFDKEDKHLAMQYLRVVMAHFEWPTTRAIKELLKDENKLFEKFNSWKTKQKKLEAE